MLYTLEQGPVEATIIEQCIRQRMPLPERIANAPSLWLGLELYYLAFHELSTCRSVGYGEGPISWMHIAEYCAVNGIEGEQFEDMLYFVNHMDAAYLKHRAAKLKKQSEATKAPRTRKR